jgi:lambda family phage tail tape measure protein
MAQQETTLRIKAIVEGGAEVQRLKRSAQTLGSQAKQSASDISFLAKETRVLAGATNRTENELRDSINIFRELRANVDMTSKEYRELTRDINRAEAALAKSGKSGKNAGGRFKGAAQSLGVVAGSARISPEAGVGAAIGGVVGGGVPGALVGAAIGSAVTPIRQAAGGVAEYVAELNQAKRTLAAVSTDQEEYNRVLKLARQISKDYSVSLLETLDGYSKVSAAARANNLTIKETEQIYRGMVAAGVAFGGSQADLDAIIRATTQVLSKGKVTAEEMQGQIGERLPGAVAKFAEATGRDLPQLAKDFEQGRVTIADFVAFTRKQVQDYDQLARTIGESPEKAGARLKLALDTAKENYGGFFQDTGAGFQDQMTLLVMWANENEQQIKEVLADWIIFGEDLKYIIDDSVKNITEGLKPVIDTISWLSKQLGKLIPDNFGEKLTSQFEIRDLQVQLAEKLREDEGLSGKALQSKVLGFKDIAKDNIRAITDAKESSAEFKKLYEQELKRLLVDALGLEAETSIRKSDAERKEEIMKRLNKVFNPEQFAGKVEAGTKKAEDAINKFVEGAKAGFDKYKEGLEDVAGAMSKTVGNAFQKLEDTLVDFVTTGKFAFKDLAKSIIKDLTRIAIQQTIMRPLTGWLGGIFPNIFGKNAKGNVYAANGIQKFARGGIVDKPTVFPFKNGIGLMGEAGAESIMPLKRGKDGKLGVIAHGGGSTVVNVSVDASGTSVEGDEEQSRQFGQVLAAAIQAEIIDQKRPGGLLSS